MRGLTLLTTLALALVIAGTAQAGHFSSLTEATDATEDTLEVDLDPVTYAFERLVLPTSLHGTLEGATGHAEAHLPGPNQALALDAELLHQRSLLLPGDLHTPFDGSFEAQPSIADGDTVEPVDATGPDAGATTSSLDDEPGEDEKAMQPAAPSQQDEEDAAKTNSEETAQSASSSLKDAWNERSTAEKAAIGAGLLSMLVFGPLTLYSRIKRDDALENDTRRSIYEIVEANPGVCIKDVADGADVSYSTASYHLDRLVRMDYLARRKDGNKALYYKNGGTFTQKEQQLVPLLKNTEAMRVFEHILENPWCYRAEIAEALGVSHTTINWHLDNLQEANLVEEHREGRSCHLRIPEPALDRVVSVIDKLDDLGVEEDYARVSGPVPA